MYLDLLTQYCQALKIENQQLVIDDPAYQKDENCSTFAIWLEMKNIPVPKTFQYDPNHKFKNGATTAMALAHQDIPIKEYWYHDPLIKDDYGETVAMYLAFIGKKVPKQWEHDPSIQDNQGFTVQDFLQLNNMEVPDQWKTQDCEINPRIFIGYLCIYCRKYRINKQVILDNTSWEGYDGQTKETFAMELVTKGIIPQKQFVHDPNIKFGSSNKTIRYYLEKQNLPIPNEWYDDEYKLYTKYKPDCVNDAIYGIIADRSDDVKAEQQYEFGWTAAMLYASQDIIPPECWNHNPSLQNGDENTVAILLAKNKILNIPKQWEHDSAIQNYRGETVAINYAYKGIIPPQQWQHDPLLKDEDGDTVALNLAHCNIIPPQEWHHNPEFKNNKGQTLALILAKNAIIPPIQWEHNPCMVDDNEKTVQDYLIENGKEVPTQWKVVDKQIEMTDEIKQKLEQYCQYFDCNNQQLVINYPAYQKENCPTFAMFLAQQKIIPPKEFEHDPAMIVKNNYTVAMILANKGIIPPKQWLHDPTLKGKQGYTVAMSLLIQEITPPEEWEHDKYLQDGNGYNIQYYYLFGKKQIPEHWQITKEIQMTDEIHQYLQEYCDDNDIVNEQLIIQHPEYQPIDHSRRIALQTFAIFLADEGIIPPKEFCHDPKIKDDKHATVAHYLAYNNIDIPEEWYIDPTITTQLQPELPDDLASKLKDNEIKEIAKYYKLEQTVAMIYAFNGTIPSQQWQHDPLLKNKENQTVAIQLAQNGVIPPQQWYHDPCIADIFGKTVQDYLIQNNVQIPTQWKIINKEIEMTDEIKQYLQQYCEKSGIEDQQIIINYPGYQNKRFGTFSMFLADHNILPPQEFNHDPLLEDKDCSTVAIRLEVNDIEVPKQWQYDPLHRLSNDMTTAMRIAVVDKIPSKLWQHKPDLQNDYGFTVALLLTSKGIVPPEQWMHNIYLQDSFGQSIFYNLTMYRNVYINNQFIPIGKRGLTRKQYIQPKTIDDTCQICFNQGEQEFIETNCMHKICLSCLSELMKNNKCQKCPVCRQQNWIKITQLQKEENVE